MVKRSPIGPAELAGLPNVLDAVALAARGKRTRHEVRAFFADFEAEVARIQRVLRGEERLPSSWQRFRIWDPKPRLIEAPSFRERVLHHALFAGIGPVLERTLIEDSFACRERKGTLAAVARAQEFGRRWRWVVQGDVRAYFASIDHAVLQANYRRRLSHPVVLRLLDELLARHGGENGRGLPIGALFSQHLANSYLAPFDRFAKETLCARGYLRYMDDFALWFETREEARASREPLERFLQDELRLELHAPLRIQRAEHGITLLGFRLRPRHLTLSTRRKRRYHRARRRWEDAYRSGWIDAPTLQRGYASAFAITAHAKATAWRRAELLRHPALDV